MVSYVENLILSPNPLPLLGWGTIYFFSIYVFAATSVWALAKLINLPIEKRPLLRGQILSEIVASMRSVLLFGVGLLVPWLLIEYNWATVQFDASLSVILVEGLVLILWNDLHFYVIHRLFHKYFKKLHAPHHRATVATPFSAYSMSVAEAVLLGSVMPLAMLAHEFSLIALLLLPVWSITINALAHSNCTFAWGKQHSGLKFILHHQAHHSKYHGNYSFFFNQLDSWFHSHQKID